MNANKKHIELKAFPVKLSFLALELDSTEHWYYGELDSVEFHYRDDQPVFESSHKGQESLPRASDCQLSAEDDRICHIASLPPEIMLKILGYLQLPHVATFMLSSKMMWERLRGSRY